MMDRKSKMVSFRLSPEEYEQLRQACSTRGVRSVSDLAREAMHHLLGADGGRAELSLQIEDLRRRVHDLSREVDRLSMRVS